MHSIFSTITFAGILILGILFLNWSLSDTLIVWLLENAIASTFLTALHFFKRKNGITTLELILEYGKLVLFTSAAAFVIVTLFENATIIADRWLSPTGIIIILALATGIFVDLYKAYRERNPSSVEVSITTFVFETLLILLAIVIASELFDAPIESWPWIFLIIHLLSPLFLKPWIQSRPN